MRFILWVLCAASGYHRYLIETIAKYMQSFLDAVSLSAIACDYLNSSLTAISRILPMRSFQSRMHRIFTQFDLLHQVTRESNPRDWSSLVRVSRLFFSATAPLVWYEVEGVHNLVALFPGVEIKLTHRGSKWPKSIVRAFFRVVVMALTLNDRRFVTWIPEILPASRCTRPS
jgi:hypothetical protein